MKRLRSGAGLVMVWLLLTLARPAHAQASLNVAQPDASHFPEIRLYCYPSTGGDRVIPNLAPTQFRVREDGRDAALLSVQGGGAEPLAVCLVLDRSGSMELPTGSGMRKIDAARDAARRFIETLRATDRAALISFSSESSLDQELTDNKPALIRALAQYNAFGSTVLYDATYWGIQQVALKRGGGSMVTVEASLANARRAVLLLTDGNDNGSREQPDRIIAEARANGVSLYTIGLGTDADSEMLAYLARQTGGEYYPAPTAQELDEIYARMARRFRAEYTVTYRTPRPDPDGTRRQVALTVDAGGLPPANGWYQAPGRGSMVVATGPAGAGTSPVATSEQPGPAAALGVLLMGAGIAAVLTCGLVAFGLRRRGAGAPLAAPGQSVDYGALWVHGPVTRIGRDATSDVMIDSARVSRNHARIEAAGGEYRIIDEGSSNGTRVNGREVRDAPLHPGDEVQFGDARFRFIGESPE